jgi:radical SAM protein with 4Fe4S-binding SPASM domain
VVIVLNATNPHRGRREGMRIDYYYNNQIIHVKEKSKVLPRVGESLQIGDNEFVVGNVNWRVSEKRSSDWDFMEIYLVKPMDCKKCSEKESCLRKCNFHDISGYCPKR